MVGPAKNPGTYWKWGKLSGPEVASRAGVVFSLADRARFAVVCTCNEHDACDREPCDPEGNSYHFVLRLLWPHFDKSGRWIMRHISA